MRLRSRRLALEPVAPEDLAWFTALNRHPDVRRHLWDGRAMGNAPSLSLARSLGFVNRRIEDVEGRSTAVLRLTREREESAT